MQSNYPSIKTLMRVNRDKTSLESARLARTILTAKNREELESLPVYEQYYQKIGIRMYNPHSLVDLKLYLLDIVLDGYGVESFETRRGGHLDYINFGETYTATVIYWRGRFLVSSWGDVIEKYNL